METLLNPIFEYWCDFYSDDNSNFLDDDLEAIQAILDYYYKVEKLEHPITTKSIALIQTTGNEHLFIVDAITENFDIIAVRESDGKRFANKIATFPKLHIEPKLY